jgi:hypothetical protein
MKLLTVIPLLAGIAAAQTTYVATQTWGPGYLTSSYNGAMTGVGPWVTLGYYKVQDGDLSLATWKGWYYGSKIWPAPDVNLAPFVPPVPVHNPPFTQEVVVLSACEGQAVGYAQPWATFSGSGGGQIFAAPLNAMLWSADGSSVVNLQNSNTNSRALGCDGVHQVGERR